MNPSLPGAVMRHPDVLIVHDPGCALAVALGTRLTRAGAEVRAVEVGDTDNGMLEDLVDAARSATIVVASPGLSKLWVGILAGVRAASGREPVVSVGRPTGPTIGQEAVAPEATLAAVCRRLDLSLSPTSPWGTLPRRRDPVVGSPWPRGFNKPGDCLHRDLSDGVGVGACRTHPTGVCATQRALILALSSNDELVGRAMRAIRPFPTQAAGGAAGLEAMLAVRGEYPRAALPLGVRERIDAARETLEATRESRAARLIDYRSGVVGEPLAYEDPKGHILRDPDIGALFAGDPLLSDPCEDGIGPAQLGSVTFWLSALQHRTLPDLLEHLRSPRVVSGRVWGHRAPSIHGWQQAPICDTLQGVIELYPPRSEAEVVSWMALVQQRLPVRMAASVNLGVRSWPGLDRRLVEAMHHGIGDYPFRDWHGALQHEEPSRDEGDAERQSPKLVRRR